MVAVDGVRMTKPRISVCIGPVPVMENRVKWSPLITPVSGGPRLAIVIFALFVNPAEKLTSVCRMFVVAASTSFGSETRLVVSEWSPRPVEV